MFHHRFLHLFHFRPLHYGATKKLGANQLIFAIDKKVGNSYNHLIVIHFWEI